MVVLGGFVVLLMLTIAIRRHHLVTFLGTLLGLSCSIAACFASRVYGEAPATFLFITDDFALFFTTLLLAAGGAVALLSYPYLKSASRHREEFYLLLLLACLGAVALVASIHFASFFLGLELLSVSLYALVAYAPDRERCVEAGFKYLVVAGASSAFLLFGMALIYARAGTMEFDRLAIVLTEQGLDPTSLAGVAMLVVGIGFKLALVPFHLWTPDVYQGSPAPVTALVATVSKGAVLALLIRVFVWLDGWSMDGWMLLFAILAVASMFGGNLLALFQTSVKRLLAYSSIAHLGYVLVAILAGGREGIFAVSFYLVAYFVTTLGTFGIVSVLSGGDEEADHLADYRGLGRRRPLLALVFTVMLLSLAGIPLTAGFIGKFLVLATGVTTALWALVVLLAANSAIGLFYYLRVIVTMYMHPRDEVPAAESLPGLSLSSGFALAALSVLLVFLGIYPLPLFRAILVASASLF
jgi:NADH-quinone oxidoreductase subunit N